MLDNVSVDLCQKCYADEDLNKISSRQTGIKDMKVFESLLQDQINKHISGEELEPFWYDLRISNNCNLSCQTCGPTSSSSIAKSMNIENQHLSFEPEMEINPNSIRIYLAGGEPFMIKRFVDVLESVENKDCEIVVNTNGTIITKALTKALSYFNNVCITVSLDGFSNLNEKIRIGSNWNVIDANINIFKKLGFHLHAQTVLQKDNINDLLTLGHYIENAGFTRWTLIELDEPIQFSWKMADQIDQEHLENLMKLKIVNKNISSIYLLNSVVKRWQKKN